MADVYTVYAFLRETPDVQKTVVKLFAQGDIWLDTSVLLPLFAEDLLDPSDRAYTNIFRAAVEAGLRLYMTPGVLQEVNAHMLRSRTYARRSPQDSPWRGTVPFLFAAFSLAGGHRGQFAGWLETFRGEKNPEDDIADYAQHAFGISLRSLEKEADQAPERLRYAVQEIFHEAQERRDRKLAADTQALLVAHDVENYVGVVQLRRRGSRDRTLGHRYWWLTLDSAAFRVSRELKNYLNENAVPASPALSPDFMVTYLAIGPLRNRISKGTEASLPLATDLGALELLPHEVLDEADRIRGELSNLRPHVIDRRVRDGLDAARQRLGPLARAGAAGMEEELKTLLRTKAGVG